jgi:hypothetical protein
MLRGVLLLLGADGALLSLRLELAPQLGGALISQESVISSRSSFRSIPSCSRLLRWGRQISPATRPARRGCLGVVLTTISMSVPADALVRSRNVLRSAMCGPYDSAARAQRFRASDARSSCRRGFGWV